MKAMIYVLVLMLVISTVAAATVSRTVPDRVAPGETITVAFAISGAEADKLFTLEDVYPESFVFKSWEVTGSKEAKADIETRTSTGKMAWSFTAASASMQITYLLDVPLNAPLQTYDFDAVWFDPAGQSRDQKTITVRNIACGDGVCEGTEDFVSCGADCTAPAPPAPPPEPTPEPVTKPDRTALIVVVIIVVAGIVIYYLYSKKKGGKEEQQLTK